MFLSNTGPEPLKNHKATKPAFNVGPPSAHQRNAIYMAISGWLMMARFYCFLDPLSPHTKKKKKKKNEKETCHSWVSSGNIFWMRECYAMYYLKETIKSYLL